MMRESVERRGTLLHKMLTAIPGVTCMEPQGAFFCFR
jgi:aspartate aminotransferase